MPQISQFAENWYAASQIFWVLLTFGFVFFVIGRGMLPKIEATVDARDRKVADDLAAAKAAHAAADAIEESYRQQSDASRVAAQKAVADAKDKAARDAEKRLAKVDAEIQAACARVEHADMDVFVRGILVHAQGEVGVLRRRAHEVAAQALRTRQVRGQAVGDAQSVILGLASQDFLGEDVFVIVRHVDDAEAEQHAHHEAKCGGGPRDALAQGNGGRRAHAGMIR